MADSKTGEAGRKKDCSPIQKDNGKIDNCCSDEAQVHSDENHAHADTTECGWKNHWQLLLAVLILVIMLTLEFGFEYIPAFPINLIIFGIAYLLAGYNVLHLAFRKAMRFDFFNEFF